MIYETVAIDDGLENIPEMNIELGSVDSQVLLSKSFVIYEYDYPEDRQKLEAVIIRYGGQVKQELDPSTSFLITTPARATHIQNPPIQTAIHWGIPVVSETFIWQCLANKNRITPHDLVPQSRSTAMVERLLAPQFASNPSSAHSHFSAERDVSEEALRLFGSSELAVSLSQYMVEPPLAALNQYEDSDDDEVDGLEHNLPSSSEKPKYLLFPLVPPETSNHVEQRLEWQRLLSTYLTGDELEKERKMREQNFSLTSGGRSEKLWIELNAKLLKLPVEEFCRQLDIHRNECIGLLMNNVIGFSIDDQQADGDCFAASIVEATILQYQDAKSLFPTKAAFLKYLTETGVDKDKLVKEIMDPLQAWLTLKKTMYHIIFCIKSLFCCPDMTGPVPHQVVQELLESRSIRTLFNRRIFSSIDDLCAKFKEAYILYENIWTEMHLESLKPSAMIICNFPLQLMQSCLSYRKLTTQNMLSHISSKTETETKSIQLLTSISQFLEDLRDGLSVAITQREKFSTRMLIFVSDVQLQASTETSSFRLQLIETLKLYLALVQDLFRWGRHGFWYRNQELLESEWLYLKQLAIDIKGVDEMITDCVFHLIYRSVQLMSYWLQTEIHPPLNHPIESKPETEKALRKYTKLLENIQLRSRKLLQFCKHIKSEFETCSLMKINSDLASKEEFVSIFLRNGYTIYKLAGKPVLIISLVPCGEDTLSSSLCFSVNSVAVPVPLVLISAPDHLDSSFVDVHPCCAIPLEKYLKPDSAIFVAKNQHEHALAEFVKKTAIDRVPVFIPIDQKLSLSISTNHIIHKIDKSLAKFIATIMAKIPQLRLYLTAAPVDDIASTDNSPTVDLLASYFSFFSSLGNQTLPLLPRLYKSYVIKTMMELAIEWISFTCSDCSPLDRKTFRWAMMALEFVMWVTRGGNILILSEEAFTEVRRKVACCMTLLISGIGSMGEAGSLEDSIDPDEYEFEDLEAAINEVLQKEHDGDYASPQQMLNQIDTKREQALRDSKRIGKVMDSSNPTYQELMNLLSVSISKVSIRWQQGKYIGGGAFGHVYLGINMDTGDLMAVKEIQFQSTPLSTALMAKQSFASQNTHISQIKDEMRVLEQMNHPNVVQYFGIEIHKDRCMLFMEYCPNGSLRGLLENSGGIEDETIIALYSFELMEGIRYLHAQQIIHRDIKPDNILFDHNGTLKLVDFGAAKIVQQATNLFEQKEVRTSTVKVKASLTGTANYVAPEVITGKVDKGRFGAQDIWSAGCVIVEMATGKRPWSNLDNEWAILYNIGLSHKHPDLPCRKSQSSLAVNAGTTKKSSVLLSDIAVDMLDECFKTADCRPSAQSLLDHRFFDDVKTSLTLYRMQATTPYPNPWTTAVQAPVSPTLNIPSSGMPSFDTSSNSNFQIPNN